VRHGFTTRESDLQLEVAFEGGDREVERHIELELTGQGKARTDRR
jgi:hypothetical protein